MHAAVYASRPKEVAALIAEAALRAHNWAASFESDQLVHTGNFSAARRTGDALLLAR
jgi:hypothetical protein